MNSVINGIQKHHSAVFEFLVGKNIIRKGAKRNTTNGIKANKGKADFLAISMYVKKTAKVVGGMHPSFNQTTRLWLWRMFGNLLRFKKEVEV